MALSYPATSVFVLLLLEKERAAPRVIIVLTNT
jgi:hypothetical protein